MSDVRILVVDDDFGVRRILKEVLTRAGYSVTEARDGAEALLRTSGVGFDLVTMDLVMGQMDGVDAISVLHNETQAPILVISAHLNEANRQELEARGVKDWLNKPFSTKDVLAKVQALLEDGPSTR